MVLNPEFKSPRIFKFVEANRWGRTNQFLIPQSLRSGSHCGNDEDEVFLAKPKWQCFDFFFFLNPVRVLRSRVVINNARH